MSPEYLTPIKHTLKILCKSIHFPRRYRRKRECVFFTEHNVLSRLIHCNDNDTNTIDTNVLSYKSNLGCIGFYYVLDGAEQYAIFDYAFYKNVEVFIDDACLLSISVAWHISLMRKSPSTFSCISISFITACVIFLQLYHLQEL